jgi:hypothetical protein
MRVRSVAWPAFAMILFLSAASSDLEGQLPATPPRFSLSGGPGVRSVGESGAGVVVDAAYRVQLTCLRSVAPQS